MKDHTIIEDVFEVWQCKSLLDIFYRTRRVAFKQVNGGTVPTTEQHDAWRSDHGDKEVCWIPYGTPKWDFICNMLKDVVPPYDCYKQVRHIQIICYPKDGLFHWHKDIADKADRATALFTLNDDYRGGDLVVEDLTIHGKQGRMVAFNNSTERWHTVSPILKGERLVLAVWFGDGTIPLEGHHE